MPFSTNTYLNEVNTIVSQIQVIRFLDIGAGTGKYGEIVRQSHPNSHRIGLEVENDYIQKYQLHQFYNEIWNMRAEDLVASKLGENYDLVIFGDTIEHLRKSDGIDLLNFLVYHTKYLLILYPEQQVQGAWQGYKNEAHISLWSEQDFHGFDYRMMRRAKKRFVAINGFLLNPQAGDVRVQDILDPKPDATTIGRHYFIDALYQSREVSEPQPVLETPEVIAAPEAYLFAAHIARHFEARYVIDLDCGVGYQLSLFHPEFQVIGVGSNKDMEVCRERYAFGEWLDWDFEKPGTMPLQYDIVRQSVIICANLLERLRNPEYLLFNLKQLLDDAPVAVITTPDRDRTYGYEHHGPPENPARVREWSLSEFKRLLNARNFSVDFAGYTLLNDLEQSKHNSIAVLANNNRRAIAAAPDGFRVVAFLPTHNESDVLPHCLHDLLSQGLEVYIIDDWSDDGTYEIAQSFLGQGVIGVERFPAEGPSNNILTRRTRRIEELCRVVQADWFILHNPDEIRETPWPGVRMKDGVYYVDSCGFNCLDYTVLGFEPVDNNFRGGADFGAYFRHYQFGTDNGHYEMHKGWKNFGQPMMLAETGTHSAFQQGKRVFPYKFLLRHYPIRSQQHGEKKVRVERIPRYDPDEREKGLNHLYDNLGANPQFVKDPDRLLRFDGTFYSEYLVERLSGIGILRGVQLQEWCAKVKASQVHRAAMQAEHVAVERNSVVDDDDIASVQPPVQDFEEGIMSTAGLSMSRNISSAGTATVITYMRRIYQSAIPLNVRLRLRDIRKRLVG